MLESGYGYGSNQLITPIGQNDHIMGNPEAAIRIVEYGDFECPFCRAAYPKLKRLHPLIGDNLCFAFRHFPIRQAHYHAEHAAESAEIAAAYGKFWEMHDMLFENQDALDDRSLVGYATKLGVNEQDFMQRLISHEYAKRVRADFMGGVRSGVNGTPTFFWNEARFDGTEDYLISEVVSALS
jgi:protein-disulfide isomerase